MRLMLERTVKGALLTNLLFVIGILLSQWAVYDKYHSILMILPMSILSAIYVPCATER